MTFRLGIHSALITVLLLAFTSCASAMPVDFPATPAGRQAAAWLDTFNTGNRDSLKNFLSKNFPSRAEDVDQEMGFREMTGGFDLRKVEESTPTKLTALVQERTSDQFARLVLEVEGKEPHQIISLDLRVTSRPAEFPLPHLAESALLTAVEKRLNDDSAADRFAGAAVISKNGKLIFSRAFGFADRQGKIPNTLKTRFRIGSMNKMFTAVATLQLVQAGKLKLDDTIGKYLTDYPNKDVSAKVTVHHLLTHTGGTGDIFGPDYETHRLELRTLQDYVKLYGSRGLQFEPGSRWAYSNYGFILLGVLIEKVSGKNYYDYVRDHIYVPAGMTASGSEPEDQKIADRSIAYSRPGPGAQWELAGGLPYRGTSAGGGYSTVEDLLRFATALQKNQLLNAQHTELLTTGKVDAGMGRYAYGFADRVINGTKCFGHGGGAPGMNGDLAICPGPGYVIAVLANVDPPAASRISDFITNRLPQP